MSKSSLVLVAILVEFSILIQLRQIHDVDLFWQLKCGQLILDSGRLGAVDTFSYTHLGEQVPSIYWLSQLIYAALFRSGSWRALLVLHSVLFAGAFGVVGLVARKQGAGPFSVCLAMALGFLTGFSNGDLRPQSFGLFCFSILLLLVSSELSWPRKLLLAGLVLVFWQNCHPSVPVGVVALGGLATACWIDWLRAADQRKPWGISLLLVMAVFSQFATPDGARILETNRANLRVAREWLQESEWQPPWSGQLELPLVLPFWIALIITLALLLALCKRVRLRDWLTIAALTPLALYATRFALFWGFAMVPIWANWVEMMKPRTMFAWGDASCSKWTSGAVLLAGACLAFLLPPALQGSMFDSRIPLEGVRRLKSALPGAGRIYNYRQWSGPLILEGNPEWKVAIDGRLYVYKRLDEWNSYYGASSGQVPLEELVRLNRPDAFFLHPGSQRPLVEALRRSHEWSLVYQDDNCIVFLKRTLAAASCTAPDRIHRPARSRTSDRGRAVREYSDQDERVPVLND